MTTFALIVLCLALPALILHYREVNEPTIHCVNCGGEYPISTKGIRLLLGVFHVCPKCGPKYAAVLHRAKDSYLEEMK